MKRAFKNLNTNTDEQKASPIRPLKNNFVRMKHFLTLFALVLLVNNVAASVPTSNPFSDKYGTVPAWTNEIRWNNVLDITTLGSPLYWDDLLTQAMNTVANNGGGIVYFPAGTYQFSNDVVLLQGVVIRGESSIVTSAKSDSFAPLTRFEFPQYIPVLSGDGTPNSSAFKTISATGSKSNLGLVHLDINRGRIYISVSGRNLLVFGVRQNNVAIPQSDIPSGFAFMHPWQRFSYRMASNISVYGHENISVVNNRVNDLLNNKIHPITDDSYDQPDYVAQNRYRGSRETPTGADTTETIGSITYDTTHIEHGDRARFDYLNHYGIRVSGKMLDPALLDSSIDQKIEVVDNWLYNTMRVGYFVEGIGVVFKGNFRDDNPNKRVFINATGSSLNKNNAATYENRAMNFAGDNIIIEDNDMRVYRHKIMYSGYSTVDGEGILEQTQDIWGASMSNIYIRNNKVNSYIGFYDLKFDVRNVEVIGNNLMGNGNILFFKKEDGDAYRYDDIRIENNDSLSGLTIGRRISNNEYSVVGTNIFIKNNTGMGTSGLNYPCLAEVDGNTGFASNMTTCTNFFGDKYLLSPTFGDLNLPKNVPITVTFEGNIQAISSTGVTLKDAAGESVITNLTFSGNQLIINHNGLLKPNEKYTVYMPFGVATGIGGYKSKEMTWWFKTSPRPYARYYFPTDTAFGIALDVDLKIEFMDTISVIDLSNIQIKDEDNNYIPGVSASLSANQKTLQIQHGLLSYAKKYTIIIPPSSVKNKSEFENNLISWSFNTRINSGLAAVDDAIYWADKFVVYPNPVNEFLYIESRDISAKNYTLYNQQGRILISGKVSNNTQINMNGISSGIYFLQIGHHVAKIIKK